MKASFSHIHCGDLSGLKDIALSQHFFIVVVMLALFGRGWFPAALVPMVAAVALALIVAAAASAFGDCLQQAQED